VPSDVTRQAVLVNGQPGIVVWQGTQPFVVFTLEAQQGLIRNICVITTRISFLIRVSRQKPGLA
jgi:hypothetical protein